MVPARLTVVSKKQERFIMIDYFASDEDFAGIESEVAEDFDQWMNEMLSGPEDY